MEKNKHGPKSTSNIPNLVIEKHGGGGVKPSIVPNNFTTGTVLDVRGGRRGTDDKGVAKLDKG